MNTGASTKFADHEAKSLRGQDIACVRGGKLLFRGLNFEVSKGEALLISGQNGVGKSSLLRLVAGLLPIYSGELYVPQSLAICDHHMALDENLSLAAALAFWAQIDGKPVEQSRAAMAAAGLSHLAEIPIRYFSTGQRQRARLARTFLSDASLWLLDEPANGLDTTSVTLLGTALQDHLQRGGMILAASHIALPIPITATLDLTPFIPPDEPV